MVRCTYLRARVGARVQSAVMVTGHLTEANEKTKVRPHSCQLAENRGKALQWPNIVSRTHTNV